MAARLSALYAGHFLPPGRFLVLISVRGCVEPRAIVQLEGLGKLKKFTSSGSHKEDSNKFVGEIHMVKRELADYIKEGVQTMNVDERHKINILRIYDFRCSVT
jgi:hypothetical protein